VFKELNLFLRKNETFSFAKRLRYDEKMLKRRNTQNKQTRNGIMKENNSQAVEFYDERELKKCFLYIFRVNTRLK